MTIAIIDYGSGNLHSVAKAFACMAEPLGRSVMVTNKPDDLKSADHIVLPGVGAFGDCVAGLKAVDGMVQALEEHVIQTGKPFLGICVGMQMMLQRGMEHGEHQGLGWIGGEVVALTPDDPSLRIPHMGWNDLVIDQSDHPIFNNINTGNHAYFVHSFHAHCTVSEHQLAHVEYGGPISACIGRDNMVGTQFHPEKSQQVGLTLIDNFIRW